MATTTTSKLTTTLPVSPIVPAGAGPVAEAGVVQINLGAETGQVVTGGEFGLATTMGTPNWSYQSYADPAFQAVADQYPTDLLRHNWELNTQMDILFPSRGSAGKPDYSHIDNYLNQQGNLKGFFNNDTGTQIVTLGFPSWLNIGDPADQALYAGMVKGIAQHFIDKGEPIPNYELVNEPDGHANITDLAHTFNAVADALHSLDPGYKLGGLTESYVHQDDLKTFFGICGKNVGFVSWHQYVTGDSGSKSSQQEVTDSLNGAQSAGQAVRALMQASGIPDSVPLFLGEYNVDGGDYNDPANANMVGAVAAAATTYGMIHSNANFTMGALWDVQNDSAYSVFGHQGSYQVDPVGVVLADLTATMPGTMVQTTMPGNTPGLVGYTTKSGAGFSTALINTSLSQGYTVDLGKDGLPATGLYRVEVSTANPKGSRTALADLSHVSVAAGSVVIVTNEAPHGGTELNGTTSTAPASAPAGTPDPNTPPPAAGPGSTSPSGSATQATAGTTAADPGKAAAPTTTTVPLPSGTAVAPAASNAGISTPAGTTPAVGSPTPSQGASTISSNPAESFAPSARGGSLLPSGSLSTNGNQVVDAAGNPVRIDAIGWYGTDGPAGSALQGLWSTSYGQILDSIKGDGFNAVRIPWSDTGLNTPFAGTNALGGVDWSQNADLKGLTTLQVFGKIVDYAGKIGLKVIFDHHTDDGSGGQQPNGLWIDKGPGTNGTDGAGVQGTVDAAKFQADWVQLAKSFAGNATVIGFDLDNEPTAQSATWGGGGPTDIQKMYTDVGNAVEAADPGALVIAEGLVTPDGQGGYPMTLAAAKGNPVVLNIPNKVVYSVHSYPAEIGGGTDATGPAAVKAMTDQWGYLEAQNIAPVWVGEMGSNMTSTGSQAWSKTLLGYMNGQDGAQGGPTFGGSQQPVGGSWWNIGSEGGQGNPDGNQTAWGPGHYKPEQQAVTDQMLFKPGSGAVPAAASGTGQAMSSAGGANPGNATPGGTFNPSSMDNSGTAGTSTAAAGTDPGVAAAPGGASPASTTAPPPAGTGADTLVLTLSEDAYQGYTQHSRCEVQSKHGTLMSDALEEELR